MTRYKVSRIVVYYARNIKAVMTRNMMLGINRLLVIVFSYCQDGGDEYWRLRSRVLAMARTAANVSRPVGVICDAGSRKPWLPLSLSSTV